jgi:hypothetical protein
VQLSAVPKGEEPAAYLSFNRNGYSSYCRVFREYWEWVEKRNKERYANTVQHGKNYDAKNMLHVFRLLQMAEGIALTGTLQVRRPNREFLLQIRRGEFEYAELVAEAEQLVERVEAAFATSALPDAPDPEAVETTLRKVRQAFYAARHATHEPG